ncbi:flagellar hook-length control protein FliK [Terrisporobacter vanillatitrophus]|uniref:flagellar hook-length control protein FliK n=1 Tax=Terrisporobacter vanillatitrophus TaxID=3058402 RepID=UPI003365FE3A
MEFNLSLSTTVADIINYLQGNSDNILGKTEQGIFDKVLEGLFEDSDKSKDIDYNLILNLLNNLKLFNTQEDLKNMDKVYTELDNVEGLNSVSNNINEINLNMEENDFNINTNSLSSEELKILNNLKNNLKNEYITLNNETRKIELSDKEIEVLKKLDSAISNNKDNTISNSKIEENNELFQRNKLDNVELEKNEKFSQLETSNTTDKLNSMRNNELDKESDKELDTLESILNGDNDNNFILNNNQLANKDMNSINTTSRQEITTIRQEYIGEDIIKTVKYLKSSGQEEITIKISPRELGDMTIKLVNNQEEASVAIVISKADVFDLVKDNQGEIAKHLKDLNINVKEISVEMKGNTQNNFSSNLNQEFERNNKGSQQGRKKNISSADEPIEDIEEVEIEDNVNILI